MKIITTVCSRDCPDTCFLDVSVENGQILKIRDVKKIQSLKDSSAPEGMAIGATIQK